MISRMSPGARKGAAGLTLVSAALLAFLGAHEGERLTVYRDIVGVPTVCKGHTGPDVVMGQTWTLKQCAAVEARDVAATGAAVLECVHVPLNQNQYEAFTSFAYNVGEHAFCTSTMARLANAGNIPAACDQMLRWNMAGGRVVQGLENRRIDERALCLRPAAHAANDAVFSAAA